jgi:hypothetical protein
MSCGTLAGLRGGRASEFSDCLVPAFLGEKQFSDDDVEGRFADVEIQRVAESVLPGSAAGFHTGGEIAGVLTAERLGLSEPSRSCKVSQIRHR